MSKIIGSRYRLRPYVVVATLMVSFGGRAQTPPTTKQSAAAQTGSSSFSIETEMLTYRALEANSEAIACDIAGVISGTKPDFSHPADGAACAVPTVSETTIILLPFEKVELEEFEQWRAAMVELAELQNKAAALGCPKSAPKAGTSTSSLSSFLSMSPAGPALSMAQTVLSLFASEEATMYVGGNIQDLAFIDDVARQLRALQISVLTPSSYEPGSLVLSDDTTSPFLASKQRTLLARSCLSTLKPDNEQDSSNVKQAISDIDDYMSLLAGEKSAKASSVSSGPNNGPVPQGGINGSAAAGSSARPSGSLDGTTANSASPLSVILRADGLARQLGFRFNVDTGILSQQPTGRYILMVKALESGGSVTGKSNILGTKLRYSGGAVGTYALFRGDGDLACSGNVYDYVGSLAAKNFERDLRNVHLNPAQQTIFLHSCSLSRNPPAVPPSNPIR
jgi:hypothetical protein